MRDTIALGLLSGFIGNAAKDLSDWLIYRAGKTELLNGHLASSMISPPEKVQEPAYFALGQILDTIVGSALSISMVYLLKITGKDHHLLKGATMGLLLWSTLYSLGPNWRVLSIKPRHSSTYFSALLNNTLYGLATAQAAVSLADRSVFPGGRRRLKSIGAKSGANIADIKTTAEQTGSEQAGSFRRDPETEELLAQGHPARWPRRRRRLK